MHTLHTTPAFVLAHRPQGESNRTFWLLTRDLGLVYARAQGVREPRNRNRYALQTGMHVQVTLVRGREGWRLTTAQALGRTAMPLSLRRVLALIREIVPLDDRTSNVYAEVLSGYGTGVDNEEALEAIVLLRVLHLLGYVTPHGGSLLVYLDERVELSQLCVSFGTDRRELMRAINRALEGARA